MGLDITAMRRITKVSVPAGIDHYDLNLRRLHINSDFPGRADDVEDGAAYHAAEDFGFRAGSYGGYNDFREQLAIMAGYTADLTQDDRHRHSGAAFKLSEGPFIELINFSDCEGVIGAAVSAKLAKDFAEYQPKADAHGGPDGDWFRARYADWRKAFEMAADAGAVAFY